MKFHRVIAARLSYLFLLGLGFGAAEPCARSQEALAKFPWDIATRTASPVALAHEEILAPNAGMNGNILKIDNPGNEPLQITLLTIVKPPITAGFYGLRGQVRYEDVAGDGYLEMWNDFPGGGHYFSRLLGHRFGDPMARLTGTSDWRDVLLPFNAAASATHPDRLTINLVLPGRGTVFLTSLELFQLDPGKMPVLSLAMRTALAAGGVAFIALCGWGVWRWQRRSRTAQWRRMTALDA